MAGGEAAKTTIDIISSPMYLHPFDGPNSFKVDPQLNGTSDYIPQIRSMEISLATKRKLGFVTGAMNKPSDDQVKKEAWDSQQHD